MGATGLRGTGLGETVGGLGGVALGCTGLKECTGLGDTTFPDTGVGGAGLGETSLGDSVVITAAGEDGVVLVAFPFPLSLGLLSRGGQSPFSAGRGALTGAFSPLGQAKTELAARRQGLWCWCGACGGLGAAGRALTSVFGLLRPSETSGSLSSWWKT